MSCLWPPVPSSIPPQIESVRRFAADLHAAQGQKYGSLPYLAHLDHVAHVLVEDGWLMKGNPDLFMVAYCHDLIEDGCADYQDLTDVIGPCNTRSVEVISNPEGVNRADKHKKLFELWERRLAQGSLYPAESSLAARVKVADRVANVENCWRAQDARLFMYHREHRGFKKALRRFSYGSDDKLWQRLDALLNKGR